MVRHRFAFFVAAALLCGSLPAIYAAQIDEFQIVLFADEIAESEIVVFCRLVARSPTSPNDGVCTFEVFEFVKGARRLAVGPNENQFQTLYFGDRPLGSDFYVCGVVDKSAAAGGAATYDWSTPMPVDAREMDYIRRTSRLPSIGPRRLVALYGYLNDPSDLIRDDVYQEVKRSTYADLRATRAWMPHDALLRWIADPTTKTTSRRQYLLMLSVCGTRADLPTLRAWIAREDRRMRQSLDALVVCELALAGESALPAIEAAFLANEKVEYTDTYGAIIAIRFAADQAGAISKPRAVRAFSLMLDRPQLADLVIPDLRRYRDWSFAPRLMQLCRTSDVVEEKKYVQVATASYLLACPTREGKAFLAELTALAPEAVARARKFYTPAQPANAVDGCGKCACRCGPRTTCRLGLGIGSSWRCRFSRFIARR